MFFFVFVRFPWTSINHFHCAIETKKISMSLSDWIKVWKEKMRWKVVERQSMCSYSKINQLNFVENKLSIIAWTKIKHLVAQYIRNSGSIFELRILCSREKSTRKERTYREHKVYIIIKINAECARGWPLSQLIRSPESDTLVSSHHHKYSIHNKFEHIGAPKPNTYHYKTNEYRITS